LNGVFLTCLSRRMSDDEGGENWAEGGENEEATFDEEETVENLDEEANDDSIQNGIFQEGLREEELEDHHVTEADNYQVLSVHEDRMAIGHKALAEVERRTTRFMTKYERARVLGTRALQISMNAPVMVELEGETDPLQIAMKELRERKIPLIIRRYLPNDTYEDWSIDELEIDLN